MRRDAQVESNRPQLLGGTSINPIHSGKVNRPGAPVIGEFYFFYEGVIAMTLTLNSYTVC